MSNTLIRAKNISPRTLTPEVAAANNLTAAYAAGRTSAWFWPEGADGAAKEGIIDLNARFDFDFDGATEIRILAELGDRGAQISGNPSSVAQAGRTDASGVVTLDELSLLPANMFGDPGSIDVSFSVIAAQAIRFRAFAAGGTTPTLAVSVHAGN